MTAPGSVGIVGLPPTVRVTERTTEQAKYELMWTRPEYRRVSPGEGIAPLFVSHAAPKPGSTVIDFGCGTGRGALMIALLTSCRVIMTDFAQNCLDEEVLGAIEHNPQRMSFVRHDLTKPIEMAADYGFCSDVMEHLPPEQVDAVLTNILRSARHCWFQISTVEDVMGALIGEPLHLTVRPFEWWLDKLRSLGAVVHWSKDAVTSALFYCSAWTSGKSVVELGQLNNEVERVEANVKWNISGPWQQVTPFLPQEREVMLVAGGPSLQQFESEIAERRAGGTLMVTLNGAYNWAIERGMKPSAQIVVDSREFNARFTHPVVDGCRYLISSQVHPSVLDGLPADRTWLWHVAASGQIVEALNARYDGRWYPIPGGSTVMLRALPLLRMLGYKRFSIYGWDSCLSEGVHHAYSQPENDASIAVPVLAAGRRFMCHPWMLSQAQEFMGFVKWMGDEVDLDVKGDGLIAWIIKAAAQLQDEEDLQVSES